MVMAELSKGTVSGCELHLLDFLNPVPTQNQLELFPAIHRDAPRTHIFVGIGNPGEIKIELQDLFQNLTHSSRSNARTLVSCIAPFVPGRTSFPEVTTMRNLKLPI